MLPEAEFPEAVLPKSVLENLATKYQIPEFRDLLERASQAKVISAKPHRSVIYFPPAPGVTGIYLKIFHPQRLRKLIELWFRLPLGFREFHFGRYLAQSEIGTPAPPGWCSYFWGGVFRGSLSASREIEGAVTLAEWLTLNNSQSDRQNAISAFGNLVSRLHRLGIYHKDLHSGNVLIRTDNSGQIELFLIDLEAARPIAGWFKWWRNKNLNAARRNGLAAPLSDSDWQHFLTEYQNYRI